MNIKETVAAAQERTFLQRLNQRVQKLFDFARGIYGTEVQYTLAHVFVREIIASFQEIGEIQELRTKLQQLNLHQLEVFLEEAGYLPFQPPYVLRVDDRKLERHKVELFDEKYVKKRDLLDITQAAIATASNGSQRQRYQLEAQQIQEIYGSVQQTMQQNDVQLLAEDAQGFYRNAIGKNFSARLFAVGDRRFYTLPPNKMYEGDKAYLNFFRVVYAASEVEKHLSEAEIAQRLASQQYSGELHVIVEPLFYEFEHPDLARIQAQCAGEDSSAFSSAEADLMRVISEVPEAARNAVGIQFFTDFFTTVTAAEEKSGELLVRQQRISEKIKAQRSSLQAGSDFLTEVLLMELTRIGADTTGQAAQLADSLAVRLHFAFGLVVSPLLQGQKFDFDQCLRVYSDLYPVSQQLTALTDIHLTDALVKKMTSPDFLRDAKNIRIDKANQAKFKQGIDQLPAFYMNKVLGSTMCNFFSWGGDLSKLNPGELQSLLSTNPLLDMNMVQKLNGSTEGWSVGKCVNPACQNPGVEQLVGPCSICLRCQMSMSEVPMENGSGAYGDSLLAENGFSYFNGLIDSLGYLQNNHLLVSVDTLLVSLFAPTVLQQTR